MDLENYFTVKDITETRTKEKGSVFMCFSYPVLNLDEAHLILESLKKKYFDALHHCYALTFTDNSTKYSDAGEPAGTAGKRILNAIQHFNLNNVLVVVVRYFGGTKLGIGPLGKAYYDSAFNNLNAANKIEKRKFIRISLFAKFDLTGDVYQLLSKVEAKILNSVFKEKFCLEFLVPAKNHSLFIEEIKQIGRGQIKYEILNSLFQ
ncbi:MAG: YigZ family protein [Ignavibacteriales bacterium]|nr:YigZ family protein [Ignavibacteriales bacterium]